MSQITKIIDERETHTQKTTIATTTTTTTKQKNKQKKQQNKGDRSYSEWVTDKRFCWALKLGFLQLICKAEIYNGRIWCSFTQTKIIQR